MKGRGCESVTTAMWLVQQWLCRCSYSSHGGTSYSSHGGTSYSSTHFLEALTTSSTLSTHNINNTDISQSMNVRSRLSLNCLYSFPHTVIFSGWRLPHHHPRFPAGTSCIFADFFTLLALYTLVSRTFLL
jgi:hypothetical protein